MQSPRKHHVKSDVFVPKAQEEAYCQTHHIALHRLENGIRIVGMPRVVEDKALASVRIEFASGSFFDPPNKQGLHHFIEHLVAKKTAQIMHDYDANFNAYTSSRALWFAFENCIAHPAVHNYGIWPLLPLVRKLSSEPFFMLENLDEAVEIEKGVIAGEIARKNADPDTHIYRGINEIMLAEDNPIRNNTLGTEESVNAITSNDVLSLAPQIFMPESMTISAFTQGAIENTKIMIDELNSLYGSFTSQEKKQHFFDYQDYDRLNPSFKQGKTYKKDTGLKTDQVYVGFSWIVDVDEFSIPAFALNRLTSLVYKHVFIYFRERMLGYVAGATVSTYDKKRVFEIYCRVKKRELSRINYTEIREEVFGKLTDALLQERVDRELLLQKAVPLSVEDRFGMVLDGLQRRDQIVDADKIKQKFTEIKKADLAIWKEKLMDEEPGIVMVGDLS